MPDDDFRLAEVIICPACAAQNLSWAMGCWECGAALFDEDESVSSERHKQENAA